VSRYTAERTVPVIGGRPSVWIVEWRRRNLKQYKPIYFIRKHSFIESFATSLSDAPPFNLEEFFLIFEGSERSVGDRLSVIDARVDGRLYQGGDAVPLKLLKNFAGNFVRPRFGPRYKSRWSLILPALKNRKQSSSSRFR
jgi:hypothetical protein